MYTIIPINDVDVIKEIEFDETDCCVIGLNTISKLLAYNNYPIKNKRIAIMNILLFLKDVDTIRHNNKDNNRTYEKELGIPMSSEILIKHFTHNHYKKYMNILKELRIMSAIPYRNNKFYQIDEYTMQYRLFNDYTNDELCIVLLKNDTPKFITDKKYNTKMMNTIKKIEIDYQGAVLAEIKFHKENNTTPNSLRIRLNTILALNRKRFIFTGFTVDRIYHSLSNISKVSRKFLHINGQKFHDVDVKNCQPLLLCYLLKSRNMPLDENYQYDCERAHFYENFITAEMNRDKVKTELYRTIFFDFKPYADMAKKFKELYPLTYNSLEIISKEKQELAGQLQNIEASIFNNLLPKKSKYFYTLFDSIYFTNIDDCIDIIKEIKNKFNEFNIKPVLTIDGETENDTENDTDENELFYKLI